MFLSGVLSQKHVADIRERRGACGVLVGKPDGK
jgi:hypothetical protein